MVNVFSRSTLAPPPPRWAPAPGSMARALALSRRVLASNPQVNVFHRGFVACDSYAGGEAAMAQVAVPRAVRAGPQRRDDPPRPPSAAEEGAQRADRAGHGRHQMITESPDQVLLALRRFLGPEVRHDQQDHRRP